MGGFYHLNEYQTESSNRTVFNISKLTLSQNLKTTIPSDNSKRCQKRRSLKVSGLVTGKLYDRDVLRT